MNSTIKIKKKICKTCETEQYIFSKGNCKRCAARSYAPIKKVAIAIPQITKLSNGELQRWFEDRHKEMKGVCQNCGSKTEKNKSTYKCSIAHILPKAYFKSVATNENNFLELCFYGKSCHTNLDNYMLDLTELACWDDVITKFCKMYPSIAKEERRRIPKVLLDYIEVE
jgi:hypothetical protein